MNKRKEEGNQTNNHTMHTRNTNHRSRIQQSRSITERNRGSGVIRRVLINIGSGVGIGLLGIGTFDGNGFDSGVEVTWMAKWHIMY